MFNQIVYGLNNFCKGQGFARICLFIVRGRHGWTDGDECFANCKGEKEKCGQATCFVCYLTHIELSPCAR